MSWKKTREKTKLVKSDSIDSLLDHEEEESLEDTAPHLPPRGRRLAEDVRPPDLPPKKNSDERKQSLVMNGDSKRQNTR